MINTSCWERILRRTVMSQRLWCSSHWPREVCGPVAGFVLCICRSDPSWRTVLLSSALPDDPDPICDLRGLSHSRNIWKWKQTSGHVTLWLTGTQKHFLVLYFERSEMLLWFDHRAAGALTVPLNIPQSGLNPFRVSLMPSKVLYSFGVSW